MYSASMALFDFQFSLLAKIDGKKIPVSEDRNVVAILNQELGIFFEKLTEHLDVSARYYYKCIFFIISSPKR